ncbi:hypothetical protein FGO68_gene17684 [Halteria grandinella]|uniref:Uncharacterized protein n=1 Tax=Halteria grandinella TaxID=5974 RepID=A0A8J8SZN5_HALGN|nr:hypothetical protein FGO68_gene17684 [Halteria grandinella]
MTQEKPKHIILVSPGEKRTSNLDKSQYYIRGKNKTRKTVISPELTIIIPIRANLTRHQQIVFHNNQLKASKQFAEILQNDAAGQLIILVMPIA